MKRVFFALALLATTVSAAELTDTEAAQRAARLEATITKSQERLNSLIKLNGRSEYENTVRGPLQAELNAWPKQDRANAAIFPYYACQQAAAALIQYGDGWKNDNQPKEWRTRVIKNFRADHQACKESLAKPDLSLKTVM